MKLPDVTLEFFAVSILIAAVAVVGGVYLPPAAVVKISLNNRLGPELLELGSLPS